MGLWPVWLRWCKPSREEQQAAIGRVPPFAEKAARRRDLVLPAELAQRTAREEVHGVWSVIEEEAFQCGWQALKQGMDSGKKNGRLVGTDDDCWLKVYGDQWNAPFFSGQTSTESGDGGEQEVRAAVGAALGLQGLPVERCGGGSEVEDRFGAGAELPDARIAHEEFEIRILTDRDKWNAGGIG